VQQAGLPTRLVIGSINLDATVIPVGWSPVFDGSRVRNEWDVAKYAVGWHKNSARPGEVGNTVLTAHSNVEGEVFRYLADVNPGNIVRVYVDGIPFDYEIDFTTIVKEAGEPVEVRERNAQWITTTADERLTLVTCWPYPHSTHRLIVVAKPVSS
jgi:sortase A